MSLTKGAETSSAEGESLTADGPRRKDVAVINLLKKWVLPVIDVNVSKYPAIISSLSSVHLKRVTDRLRN